MDKNSITRLKVNPHPSWRVPRALYAGLLAGLALGGCDTSEMTAAQMAKLQNRITDLENQNRSLHDRIAAQVRECNHNQNQDAELAALQERFAEQQKWLEAARQDQLPLAKQTELLREQLKKSEAVIAKRERELVRTRAKLVAAQREQEELTQEVAELTELAAATPVFSTRESDEWQARLDQAVLEKEALARELKDIRRKWLKAEAKVKKTSSQAVD